jgi:hypothetical protein
MFIKCINYFGKEKTPRRNEGRHCLLTENEKKFGVLGWQGLNS